MAERFTEQGLRVIELAVMVEKEFVRLEELTDSLAVNTQKIERADLQSGLSSIDSALMQHLLSLDALGELSAKAKEQRRSVLLKIQSVQSTIDNLKLQYAL